MSTIEAHAGAAPAPIPGAAALKASWRTEDWIAVVVGTLAIVLVLAAFQWKLGDLGKVASSYRWTTDAQLAARVPGWIERLEGVPDGAALREALQKGERKAIEAAAAKMAKLGSRTLPGALGAEIRAHATADAASRIFVWDNLSRALYVAAAVLVLAAAGVALLGLRVAAFVLGLPAILALAWLARFLSGNALFHDWGIEYVILALGIGLLISNTVGVPAWLRPAVQTEYFIKTGLVVLGASLLFTEIVQAGVLGIVQALLVVFVVWYACFWLCRKLKVDDEFGAMLSAAVSICGVSAAIAACGAIQGDKKKLSYVTSLVLIVAVPMMIGMPWIAKATGMDPLVAGAWLGGTLDTSASVVAAGALISEAAMKTGVIVKFSQNALIGVAAFLLAIWWALKAQAAAGGRPSAAVIWQRFPKFVLGFIAASLLFSFALPPDAVAGTRAALGELRLWWFAMAFVCIGLETRFTELASTEGGRPAAAFLGAQAINVLWTLLLAYLLFGGVLFPQPDIR